MGKVSAYGFLGEPSAMVDAIELKALSGLPLETSSKNQKIIIFPEEKTSLVQNKLKPFGIEIIINK